MLQQILKDMYIDPDVLDALNEEQKKTLFLKMREEQIRRWKEREEKQEHEEQRKPKPRPACRKSVSWLLGRDGDVQVFVIGEMDEFKPSKILYSGFGERKAASVLKTSHNNDTCLKSNLVSRITTEPLRTGRENFPPKPLSGVQHNLKEKSDEVRTLSPTQISPCELKPTSPVESIQDAEEDDAADELVDDASILSSICYRPHLMTVPKTTSLIPQDKQEKTTPLSITSRLKSIEPSEPRINRGKDFRVMAASKRSESVDGEVFLGRGRVAELMKTFSVASDSTYSQTQPRPGKPPIPSKPSHLQLLQSNSLR